jgi:hypothetical protein
VFVFFYRSILGINDRKTTAHPQTTGRRSFTGSPLLNGLLLPHIPGLRRRKDQSRRIGDGWEWGFWIDGKEMPIRYAGSFAAQNTFALDLLAAEKGPVEVADTACTLSSLSQVTAATECPGLDGSSPG